MFMIRRIKKNEFRCCYKYFVWPTYNHVIMHNVTVIMAADDRFSCTVDYSDTKADMMLYLLNRTGIVINNQAG